MSRVLPILFNTDMVRAILDERKKVTRRICKDGNEFTIPDMSFYDANKRTYAVHSFADKNHTDQLSIAEWPCPICPGDILYVRETWCKSPFTDNYIYRADGEGQLFTQSYDSEIMDDMVWKWKPSIHMPKKAARIWIKVTDVSVERLQDITNEDIQKEGVEQRQIDSFVRQMPYETDEYIRLAHTIAFQDVWDSTIKKSHLDLYGWDANPWVWVIEFERCEKPEE